MNPFLKAQRIGFLGAGNMAQAMIKGMVEGGFSHNHVFASNRSVGKLQKLQDLYKIETFTSNETLVEKSDIVILSVKPQDLLAAIEPLTAAFNPNQIVISIAAGITIETLEKFMPSCRIARVMPNTPSIIGRGVIGYVTNEKDEALETLVEDLFAPLGKVIKNEDEDQFEALMVGCSSGTGFVFELMTYWQEWLQEHGFEDEDARQMTIETFLGAAMLATQSKDSIEDLQSRVASKKGVTAAGLQSMRELEIERALRISFEKAAMRNKEMAREIK